MLGRLTEQSLRAIWHGEAYRRFRADYAAARDAQCRRCPYKRAALAQEPAARVAADGAGAEGLLHGWYDDGDATLRWARTQAALQLAAHGPGRLHVSGVLPAGAGTPNRLAIVLNGTPLDTVRHAGRGMKRFQISRRVQAAGALQLDFSAQHAFCPRERGTGDDARRLGFGLIEAAFVPDA